MSNRPKIVSPRKIENPNKLQKVKTPTRLRIHHHIGDLSGCGTIRVVQPSMILNNYYSDKWSFESMYNNRYYTEARAYADCSYVTFQRSSTKQQFDMIRHFKQNNPLKPVIYELDDDLFSIPEWNFASKFYSQHIDVVKNILRYVDGVVCSTNHLKKVLSPYNNNISVSLNHLPRFIWGDTQPVRMDKRENRKTRILYAGSHNHFDTTGTNRGDFSDELIEFVYKTTDKYQWMFVGGIPASLKGNADIIHHEWKPVIEYPRFLKSLRPEICLAPLDNIEFNKSKSNIKALESVALGVPLVASDIEPYKGLSYTTLDNQEFIGMIEKLAADPELRRSVWSEQYQKLKAQLFWEDNDYTNLIDYVNKHLRLFGKVL